MNKEETTIIIKAQTTSALIKSLQEMPKIKDAIIIWNSRNKPSVRSVSDRLRRLEVIKQLINKQPYKAYSLLEIKNNLLNFDRKQRTIMRDVSLLAIQGDLIISKIHRYNKVIVGKNEKAISNYTQRQKEV